MSSTCLPDNTPANQQCTFSIDLFVRMLLSQTNSIVKPSSYIELNLQHLELLFKGRDFTHLKKIGKGDSQYTVKQHDKLFLACEHRLLDWTLYTLSYLFEKWKKISSWDKTNQNVFRVMEDNRYSELKAKKHIFLQLIDRVKEGGKEDFNSGSWIFSIERQTCLCKKFMRVFEQVFTEIPPHLITLKLQSVQEIWVNGFFETEQDDAISPQSIYDELMKVKPDLFPSQVSIYTDGVDISKFFDLINQQAMYNDDTVHFTQFDAYLLQISLMTKFFSNKKSSAELIEVMKDWFWSFSDPIVQEELRNRFKNHEDENVRKIGNICDTKKLKCDDRDFCNLHTNDDFKNAKGMCAPCDEVSDRSTYDALAKDAKTAFRLKCKESAFHAANIDVLRKDAKLIKDMSHSSWISFFSNPSEAFRFSVLKFKEKWNSLSKEEKKAMLLKAVALGVFTAYTVYTRQAYYAMEAENQLLQNRSLLDHLLSDIWSTLDNGSSIQSMYDILKYLPVRSADTMMMRAERMLSQIKYGDVTLPPPPIVVPPPPPIAVPPPPPPIAASLPAPPGSGAQDLNKKIKRLEQENKTLAEEKKQLLSKLNKKGDSVIDLEEYKIKMPVLTYKSDGTEVEGIKDKNKLEMWEYGQKVEMPEKRLDNEPFDLYLNFVTYLNRKYMDRQQGAPPWTAVIPAEPYTYKGFDNMMRAFYEKTLEERDTFMTQIQNKSSPIYKENVLKSASSANDEMIKELDKKLKQRVHDFIDDL